MAPKRQTIRDHSAEANLVARRTVVSIIFVCILMSVIIVNLYQLQVRQYEDYQTRSNGNRIKVLPVAPNRGLIYDRNGEILAENKPVFSLEVTPEEVDNLDDTIQQLSVLMSLTDSEIKEFKSGLKRQRRFKPLSIRQQLSHEDVALFSAKQHQFPGVSIEARLSRNYPFKDTLTHTLGYVARINKKDLANLEENDQLANYAATHDIGKQGVEKFHERTLHGVVGYQQVEVNNQGRIIRVLSFEPPLPGKDIVLNIDINMQKKAQEVLAGRRGSVVVTDPNDGSVLALYSSPSYDPNLFVHGISQKEYGKLLASKNSPLLNRATQGRYPPASTIKPLLALVGLEEGVIDEATEIRDRGTYRLKNVDHVWRDWKKYGHGMVDVTKSIEVSCDIFYYDLAFKLGIDRISDSMQLFGFGRRTGIDLMEESGANMPSRGWKRARFNEPWYIGDTIPVGIGQSYWNATPLQLAQSLNFLINKGQRHTPRLIKGYMVEGAVNKLPIEIQSPIPVVDEHNWDIVLDALYGTVNRDHGTAHTAFRNTDYISAGKTGTAQLFSVAQDAEYEEENVSARLKDNAMYIGYAPFVDPEISISVVIENAGGGSSNAAPAARIVMDYYFSEIKPKGIALKTNQDGSAGATQYPPKVAATIMTETNGG
ncbi:penicillin-binding protein 2 [Brumicola nitratireducens]|uniref:Peptidoglycan D,D-transpeptidase MrdA n=1 Tax=Glaciecola nitratireducens (strain JCM 12485 / KCTC 12276 / FR1064) TaxID=1085623 RepID=G4QH02_GLANF|nr:penicillin-binding protein 2 [Glaciecola nitratireducens]AEP30190.1 cell elongation-specific transpeptidase of penicillin-binding protein 2 (peptidoglycan synthetase) [Glaciecola nitratireducens FR1064]